MCTELSTAFIYWRFPDLPLSLGAVDWAITSGTTIIRTGTGFDELITQFSETLGGDELDQPSKVSPPTITRAESVKPAIVTLIIPAEATLTSTVMIPSAKPQHIRAAVPHLIEEWSAAEVDTLHLALGTRESDGCIPVTMVARERVAQWLAVLEAAKVRCERVWVDASLLPVEPGTLTLCIDDHQRVLLCSDRYRGAVAVDALESIVSAELRRGELQRITLFATTSTNENILETVRTLLSALHHRTGIAIERRPYMDGPWQALLREQPEPLNLRQGEFILPDQSQLTWQRWRPVALVVGICAVTLLLLNLIGGAILDHRASVARAENEALYRELFPQDKRLVNVAQQFRAHLPSTTTTSRQASFMQLFSQLASVIKSNPVEPPLRIRSLVFDATTSSLQVELIVPTIQVLDAVQKQLVTQHLRTTVLSAINEEATLVGRLKISGGE